MSCVSDEILAGSHTMHDHRSSYVKWSFYRIAGLAIIRSLVDIVAIISLVCNCTIHPSLSYEPWDYYHLLVRPLLLAIVVLLVMYEFNTSGLTRTTSATPSRCFRL